MTAWDIAKPLKDAGAPTTLDTRAQVTGLPTGYLPLFPFASLAGVRAWQANYQSGGHQPWHRGPDLTPTAFAAFVGYTDVTQVARSTVRGGGARQEVCIKLPDGTISTAAITYLVLSARASTRSGTSSAPMTPSSRWIARRPAARRRRR